SSPAGTFVVTIMPLTNDDNATNKIGTSIRGFFERRNIASPGAHRTFNNSPTLLMIDPPRCFLHLFALAFNHNARERPVSRGETAGRASQGRICSTIGRTAIGLI